MTQVSALFHDYYLLIAQPWVRDCQSHKLCQGSCGSQHWPGLFLMDGSDVTTLFCRATEFTLVNRGHVISVSFGTESNPCTILLVIQLRSEQYSVAQHSIVQDGIERFPSLSSLSPYKKTLKMPFANPVISNCEKNIYQCDLLINVHFFHTHTNF